MGFENRDWAREPDAGVGLGALGDSALKAVIAANVAVFVLWQVFDGSGAMQDHFTASPLGVVHDLRIHTLVTAGFSHRDLGHLFWNLLFLWWFGRELEESIYGSRGFLALYIGGSIVAFAAHVAIGLIQGWSAPALGASGSVMAVMMVVALFFPDRPIYTFWGMFPIPIKWLVGFYLLSDLLPVIRGEATLVANAAHLGGALGGALFYYLDPGGFRVRGAGARGSWTLRWRSLWPGRRARRAAPEHVPARAEVPLDDRDLHRPPTGVDAETDARVDALLAKITQGGMAALSEDEKAFLSQASDRYKGKS